jgi:3-phosphoshikimate 1-carboxyvinyltransferase
LKLLHTSSFTVKGSGTLLHRPIVIDLKQLKDFGVELQIPNGDFLPVNFVGGKLNAGKYIIEGSRSSQFVSGLLMSLPLIEGDSELLVHEISSFPYIMLTIETLKNFGVDVFHKAPNRFIIPGNQQYKSGDYTVEGDWSSAAFLFAAGVLLGEVSISGLNPNSEQSDRNILEILRLAHVDFDYEDGVYTVKKSKISAFDYDFLHSPDLFPVALLLAVHAKGICKFTGISKLQLKESNRIDALCKEFSKSGVNILCLREELIVTGSSDVRFAKYVSYNDHRVAMSLVLHALACREGGEIDAVHCIDKSYPHFLRDIIKLGGIINE